MGLFLFWFFLVLIFYAYAGYPLMAWLAATLFRRPVRRGPLEPPVSIILSAFNEEKRIEQKLLNLLELDYPEEKLEILVGSDGASDRTDEIISRFRSSRIRFFRFVANLGKPQVLNTLAGEARNPILVFTDVRQELARNAIRNLVENFYDPEVGCVSGELHFLRERRDKAVSGGMRTYWSYEKFLRKCESGFGSMLGATGALYAIRRRLFAPIPPDMLVDDMYLPLSIVAKGFRAVFDSRAWVFDRPSGEGVQEFKRKVRTLAGNYQILRELPELLHPVKSPVAWQLFSHKYLRLLIPYFLGPFLLANACLVTSPFYRAFFFLQILFYSLAAAGGLHQTKRGIGCLPYTFCLLNFSAVAALLHFAVGRRRGAWEKAYA